MPKEIRRLAFSHNETKKALADYASNKKVSLPEGKILHARFASPGEETKAPEDLNHDSIFQTYNVSKSKNNIIITFYDDKTLEHRYSNLKADYVTASLIEYCVKNKVMLPKAGDKTIDITEFNVCLDIVIDNDIEKKDSELSLEDE